MMAMLRVSSVVRRSLAGITAGSVLVFILPAQAADDDDAILLQEIRKRDAVIQELLQRVEQLEDRVRDTVVWVDAQPDGAVVMREIDNLQSQMERIADSETDTNAADSAFAAGKRKPSGGPGAVEVDELAAERALERTLTNQGVLLLPEGVQEINPFFSYSRSETEIPLFGVLVPPGVGFRTGTQTVKRDSLSFGVGYKRGLPYNSQFELTLPYRVVHQETVDSDVNVGTSSSKDWGNSIGDISLGLAKTLAREDGWKPDLIGRVTWNTSTGDQEDNGVVLGLGFDEVTAGVTALKRQDPLAFTAGLNYTHTFEKDNVQPGGQIGFSFGTSIAASPSTSLSFTLSQVFGDEREVNGQEVKGTSINSSQFLFGWSSSLTRQTLLSFSAGVGLTDDAPDYSFNLSLPVRF